MNLSFLDVVLPAVALVVIPVVLARLLHPGDGIPIVQLFVIRADPPWPRGVQEEDPRRWRLELLERRRSNQAAGGQAAVAARSERTSRERAATS